MALDFRGAPVATMSSLNTVPEDKNEIAVVESYDIAADREDLNKKLTNSAEVDAIVSKIEVYNMETIVSFGAEAAFLKYIKVTPEEHARLLIQHWQGKK